MKVKKTQKKKKITDEMRAKPSTCGHRPIANEVPAMANEGRQCLGKGRQHS